MLLLHPTLNQPLADSTAKGVLLPGCLAISLDAYEAALARLAARVATGTATTGAVTAAVALEVEEKLGAELEDVLINGERAVWSGRGGEDGATGSSAADAVPARELREGRCGRREERERHGLLLPIAG